MLVSFESHRPYYWWAFKVGSPGTEEQPCWWPQMSENKKHLHHGSKRLTTAYGSNLFSPGHHSLEFLFGEMHYGRGREMGGIFWTQELSPISIRRAAVHSSSQQDAGEVSFILWVQSGLKQCLAAQNGWGSLAQHWGSQLSLRPSYHSSCLNLLHVLPAYSACSKYWLIFQGDVPTGILKLTQTTLFIFVHCLTYCSQYKGISMLYFY